MYFRWPAGTYVNDDKFQHIMMAMETVIDKSGIHFKEVKGTPEEQAELERSYKHLCDMRKEVIDLGIMPPVDKWGEINPYMK